MWSEVKVSQLTPDIRWDAEHYRPEYLLQEQQMRRLATRKLREVAMVTDGNHLSIAEEFGDEGVRYLRGQDLAEFFISDADPIFIPEKTYNTLARSHIFPGDVLVGIVGTIGTVGLVTERHGKLTGNCKVAIVRSSTLPGEYIAAYLASRLGQYEIRRRTRGAVQMGLILPDLKEIPILQPGKVQLVKVVAAVKGAQSARSRAAESIAAAESLMMAALGLDRLNLSPSKCYIRSFHDLQAEGRFDADYFNPKYQRVMRQLRVGGRTLANVAPLAEQPFVPGFRPKGSTFQYIEIGSLSGDGEAEATTLNAAEAPSRAAWIVSAGDVVTSTVRPVRRLSALIREDQDGCVCSSGFAVLTPKDGIDGIEAEVLLTYLRLPIICDILNLHTTASMYPAIPVDRLMRFPIVVPDLRTRQTVVTKVREAMTARFKAAKLLEQAKRMVEELIAGSGGGKNG